MRRMAATIAAAMALVTGCGGEPEPPEVSVSDVVWDSDQVVIEATTNLPDGAVLSWYVVDGDDWDDLDAADASGFADVAGGSATATVDVAEFTGDQALVEVAFIPGYDGQPAEVSDAYEPNQGAEDEATVSR